MTIGNQTIDFMAKQVEALLTVYQGEIAGAYAKSEDSLTIALSIKVSPGGSGAKVETSINFITGRIKDKQSGLVDE